LAVGLVVAIMAATADVRHAIDWSAFNVQTAVLAMAYRSPPPL
jgi:hypothetical protein